MVDAPKPRLTLVDAVLAENPPATPAALTVERAVLAKHGPAYAKRVRIDERANIFSAAGIQSIEEMSQIAPLRAERDVRPTAEEERKHCKAHYWRGFAIGGMSTGALVGIGLMFYALGLVGGTLDRAVPMRAQQSIAEQIEAERALERQAHQPVNTEPN